MSDGVFNFNFLALSLFEILGRPKFTLGGPTPPSGEIFVPKASISQCLIFVFNFNILALVLSGILGGSQIYCAPGGPLAEKF